MRSFMKILLLGSWMQTLRSVLSAITGEGREISQYTD
jgi:hypothetical protein